MPKNIKLSSKNTNTNIINIHVAKPSKRKSNKKKKNKKLDDDKVIMYNSPIVQHFNRPQYLDNISQHQKEQIIKNQIEGNNLNIELLRKARLDHFSKDIPETNLPVKIDSLKLKAPPTTPQELPHEFKKDESEYDPYNNPFSALYKSTFTKTDPSILSENEIEKKIDIWKSKIREIGGKPNLRKLKTLDDYIEYYNDLDDKNNEAERKRSERIAESNRKINERKQNKKK